MRAPGLPVLLMLSCLLLMARVLLVEGAPRGPWPEHAMGGWRHKLPIPDTFITPDQAKCHVILKEQGEGITLKVQCARLNTFFSCVFAGNPKSCTKSFAKSRIYWKQLAHSLLSQERLCEDNSIILTTRICKGSFPESSLRLVQPSQVTTTSKDSRDIKFLWQMSTAGVFPTDSDSTTKISDNQEPLVTTHFSLELSESEITTAGTSLGPEQTGTPPEEITMTIRSNSQADSSVRIESPQLTDMDMNQEMLPWIYQDLLLKSNLGPELVSRDSPLQSYLGPEQVDQE